MPHDLEIDTLYPSSYWPSPSVWPQTLCSDSSFFGTHKATVTGSWKLNYWPTIPTVQSKAFPGCWAEGNSITMSLTHSLPGHNSLRICFLSLHFITNLQRSVSCSLEFLMSSNKWRRRNLSMRGCESLKGISKLQEKCLVWGIFYIWQPARAEVKCFICL